MTLALIALTAMVALRGMVLALFWGLRNTPTPPGWLPPTDQWASLTPFLIGELPLFIGLGLWLKTGSPWAAGLLAILAVIGIGQGLTTARRDGLTLLHLDVPLAIALLAALGLSFWKAVP